MVARDRRSFLQAEIRSLYGCLWDMSNGEYNVGSPRPRLGLGDERRATRIGREADTCRSRNHRESTATQLSRRAVSGRPSAHGSSEQLIPGRTAIEGWQGSQP